MEEEVFPKLATQGCIAIAVAAAAVVAVVVIFIGVVVSGFTDIKAVVVLSSSGWQCCGQLLCGCGGWVDNPVT